MSDKDPNRQRFFARASSLNYQEEKLAEFRFPLINWSELHRLENDEGELLHPFGENIVPVNPRIENGELVVDLIRVKADG